MKLFFLFFSTILILNFFPLIANAEIKLTKNHKKAIAYDCKKNLKKKYSSRAKCQKTLLLSIKTDGILFDLDDFDLDIVKRNELSCSGKIDEGVYKYNACLGKLFNINVSIEEPPIVVAEDDNNNENDSNKNQIIETDKVKILSANDIYNKVVKSSFQVWVTENRSSDDWSCGSSVVIKRNKLATNCHVVLKEDSKGNITTIPHKHIILINLKADPKIESNWKEARIFVSDPNNDVCVIESSSIEADPIFIKKYEDIEILEKAYAIGAPECKRGVMTAGEIQNKYDYGEKFGMNSYDIPILQTNAHIRGGNSGGGLFDSKGNLIGITTLGQAESISNPFNIAISADNFLKLMNK